MDEDERKAHDRRLRERFAFVTAAKADSEEGRADMIKLRDLLPCPFCGQPASIEMTRGNGRVVYCASDDCMGPHTAAANLEDATLQWNKRPALPPLRVREEIARIIWNSFGRMGGDFDHAKGTVAYDHCCGVADAILSNTAGQEPDSNHRNKWTAGYAAGKASQEGELNWHREEVARLRTAGQEWRDISTRPDGDEPCWIAHAPSETRVVGYPARGLPKGVWRLMWTAKMLSWTPTHWMPIPAPPVAEPPTEQAPGHTDLMVTPESIDAFVEANPLPDEPVVADKSEVK